MDENESFCHNFDASNCTQYSSVMLPTALRVVIASDILPYLPAATKEGAADQNGWCNAARNRQERTHSACCIQVLVAIRRAL